MNKTILHAIKEKNIRKIVRCLISAFPPSITGNIVFFKNHHRFINYKTPELLDEKLLILRGGVYQDNDLISQCADKLAVRNYIENLNPIMKKYLIELIGIYSKAEDINWNVLPNKFVIKCNHGCGYNIIVKDKTEEDKKAICRQLNYWLEENYGIISSELHYKKIVPQIIIEKFIEGKDGSLPIDYKFFVSRGKAICCLLIVGRDTVKQRIFVDEKFDDLKLVNEYSGDDYHTLKPQSYDEMISVAKILGENFPFVRVDLYDTDGRVYFGELTFTPHGCNHDYLSYEAQKWIGDQIKM